MVLAILLIMLLLWYIFRPSLDITSEEELLLWYTPIRAKKREYIKIY